MNWLFHEPPRDPNLRKVLREIEARSPLGENDALRQKILAAARPTFTRPRSPAPRWWDWISKWMPVAVPVGLAASLAAGLLVPAGGEITTRAGYNADVSADSTLVVAAFSEGSFGGQLAVHLVAPESGDWLFEQAVTQ
jgi:hypothetical protein